MAETNNNIGPDNFEEGIIDLSGGNVCAYDKNGKLVYTEEAIKGVDYICPICRECRMRIRRIPNSNNKIFAKLPSDDHTRPECYQSEKKGKKKSIPTPRATNFVDLIDKLCHVPAPGNGGGSKGGNGGGHGGGDHGPDQIEIQEVGFSTLRQLHAFLIKSDKPEESFIENVWNYSWLTKDLVNNFTFGSKIITARFLKAYDNTILLVAYFDEVSIRIRITFRNKKDFININDKINKLKKDYVIVNENGKTIYPDINLLIASNRWIFINKNECNSSICINKNYCNICLGYYRATIFRANQVYPFLAP